MARIYILIFVIGIVGVVGYGAKYYYDTTQNKIEILQKNNAQLEGAVEIANESLEIAKAEHIKLTKLNSSLQTDLQKAEAYGDSLRNKLNKLNLVKDALTDAKDLEGRMNGATANIWRDITVDTGGDTYPIPGWLQQSKDASRNKNSNQSGEVDNTNGGTTETSTTE
tara:strand:+ start:1359 stop:1859 length:501 start_codon:yes stop_codon:yes gene_type:complete